MTTVAIVDDHSVVRIGIKYVLMTDSEFKFVGEADDGADAVPLVERVHPDILLLDVRMPGTGGIAALKEVRAKFPDQRVVMLSMSDAEEDVYQALTLGARGYVIKDNTPGRIIGALKTVMSGELAISESVRSVYEARKSERGLTGREKEILVLVSKGCSNAEIGDILHLSPNTVKNHLKNLFEALGAADRAEAVAIGIRRGLIA
ncbi:MAG: response regulator transcription factor [Kiritimatiellae bacterium]|nr:response regulator transcription factor [Kiritimatiellia bacterium]